MTKTRSARNTASRRSCVTRHDGDLARRLQVADHAPQLLAREGVERAERLVEHQQIAARGSARGRARRAAACRRTAARDTCCRSRRGRPTPGASRRARHTRLACGEMLDCGAVRTISSGSSRLSSVVRQGSSVGAWNAMPAILTGCCTISPATRTVPLNGNCSPVASFIRVDLPQPDGPTTATNSPRSTVDGQILRRRACRRPARRKRG